MKAPVAVVLRRASVVRRHRALDGLQPAQPLVQALLQGGHERVGLVKVAERVHEVELGQVRSVAGMSRRGIRYYPEAQVGWHHPSRLGPRRATRKSAALAGGFQSEIPQDRWRGALSSPCSFRTRPVAQPSAKRTRTLPKVKPSWRRWSMWPRSSGMRGARPPSRGGSPWPMTERSRCPSLRVDSWTTPLRRAAGGGPRKIRWCPTRIVATLRRLAS